MFSFFIFFITLHLIYEWIALDFFFLLFCYFEYQNFIFCNPKNKPWKLKILFQNAILLTLNTVLSQSVIESIHWKHLNLSWIQLSEFHEWKKFIIKNFSSLFTFLLLLLLFFSFLLVLLVVLNIFSYSEFFYYIPFFIKLSFNMSFCHVKISV